jgi:hypothetical protein
MLGLQWKLSLETSHIAADVRSLAERGGRLLLVYSENAENLEQLNVVINERASSKNLNGKLMVEIIPQADHLFNSLVSQEQLFKAIQDWIHPIVISTFAPEEYGTP